MIRRMLAAGIVLMFLLQMFAGIQFLHTKPIKEETTVEVVPGGDDAPERDLGTRNGGGQINHTDARGPFRSAASSGGKLPAEEDDMGGSWFDGFDDESGAEWEENVSVINERVRLADNEVIPDESCVGLWHFNDGSGDKANDSSGYGNNGTLNHMNNDNWVDGRYEEALEFDGNEDYVEINNVSVNTAVSGKNTVTFWMYWYGNGTMPFIWSSLYALHFSSGAQFGINTFNSDNLGISHSGLANKWVHVAAIFYNGVPSSSNCKIFIDGIEKNLNQQGSPVSKAAKPTTFVGGYINGYWYNGLIDDLAIYNRALSPSEISQHYYTDYYVRNATITSAPITLPENMKWSTLSLTKTEPANTYINISVINATSNTTIPGFDNLTNRTIDLTPLNDIDLTSIRLKAYFSGNGSATPSLDSWGVEWTAKNAWRDSFIGDSKVAYPYGVDEHTVGYWKFNEGTGNITHDLSNNKNNGTLNCFDNNHDSGWCDGIDNIGLKFDGIDDTVEIPDNDAWDFGLNNFQIETWLKITSDKNRNDIITRSNDTERDWFIFSIQNRKPLFYAYVNNSPIVTLWSSTELIINQWYHICVVRVSSTIFLYINGNIDKSVLCSGSFTNLFEIPLFFGSWRRTAYLFNGAIDETRISNIARTPDEIRQAYQTGIAIHGGQVQLADNEIVPDGNTSALWHFNEGEGNVLHDSSGNGNDGVIHGANWTEGLMGGALEFDGVDDYVEFGEPSSLIFDANDDITLTARIKTTKSGAQRIINKIGSGAGGYLLNIDSNDKALAYFQDTDGDQSTPISTSSINDGKWHYLVATFNASTDTGKIYIDGFLENTDVGSNVDAANRVNQNFLLGGKDYGSDRRYFRGSMDEVTIYNRALNESEIRAHANRYHHNATLRSENITLPENQTWDNFHSNRTVPDNTYLNITIHNAETNETLWTEYNSTGDPYIDLSGIDPIEHPSIYLQAHFQSNRTETPVLYDWALNWTEETPESIAPALFLEIPEQLPIIEDTPEESIINFADYFSDVYSSITPPTYTLESVSDDVNITISLNDSRLDVTYMADNWTGKVSVIVNCTNMHGLSTSTNVFNITVTPVDDAPAWNSTPPMIILEQGNSITSDYSLDEYVVDVEDDNWEFTVSSDDVVASLNEANNITIQAVGNFSGDTSVLVKVYQPTNDSLFSNISIPVRVLEGNPLIVQLLSPRNGTTIIENNVTLKWELIDRDNLSDSIAYDLYFGENRTPALYESALDETNYTMTGLKDGTTYYWYVIPSDRYGICGNGIWSFIINKSTILPEATYLMPLNGQIINKTSVLLNWKTGNWSGDNRNYDIYLGNSELNLSLNGTTKDESYLLEGLKDSVYYWKIIPWNDTVTGLSKSGIWSFTVNTSYEIVYTINVTADVTQLEIVQGKNAKFTINVSNLGNVEAYITITAVGSLKDYVDVPTNLNLQPGSYNEFVVTISGTSSLDVGDHELIIEFVFSGKKETVTIHVKIISDDAPIPSGETGKDEGLSGTTIGFIIGGVVLVLLAIIVIFIIFRKKKKRTDEPDASVEEQEIAPEPEVIPQTLPPQGTNEVPQEYYQQPPQEVPQPDHPTPEIPPTAYETPPEEMQPPMDEGEPFPQEPEESIMVSVVSPEPELPDMPGEPQTGIEAPEGIVEFQPPPELPAPEADVTPLPPGQEVAETTYRDHILEMSFGEAKSSMVNLIPNYNITQKLGAGGFGTVYKATHIGGRNVAIKLPKMLDETVDMSVLLKFQEEADIWRKLKHHNIVEFVESNIQPVPYLAIELMEGGNLKQLVSKYQLNIGEAVFIMAQILDGMGYAHLMATIHRDLKPENILFTKDGIPKISDWGIGKFMGSMSTEKTIGMKGTMLYSAPEQISKAKFGQVDWTTDIFQLGIVFYEMITRQHPFYDEDPVGIIGKITGEDPVLPSAINPKVPKELDDIIMTALQKDKAKRWHSADIMHHELKKLVEG